MTVQYVGHYGDDLLVANCARVSMAKHHDTYDAVTDTKLIEYLARHQHIAPFFHPVITLRITAPIFIARQLMRSTVGFAISEVSRRYIDGDPEFYSPIAWRERATNVKQGSGPAIDETNQQFISDLCQDVYELALENYKHLLWVGVAPEQARIVLPVATMTSWIWTGSLYAYSRMCKLRLDDHSQAETVAVALLISSIIGKLYPVSWNALLKPISPECYNGK